MQHHQYLQIIIILQVEQRHSRNVWLQVRIWISLMMGYFLLLIPWWCPSFHFCLGIYTFIQCSEFPPLTAVMCCPLAHRFRILIFRHSVRRVKVRASTTTFLSYFVEKNQLVLLLLLIVMAAALVLSDSLDFWRRDFSDRGWLPTGHNWSRQHLVTPD